MKYQGRCRFPHGEGRIEHYGRFLELTFEVSAQEKIIACHFQQLGFDDLVTDLNQLCEKLYGQVLGRLQFPALDHSKTFIPLPWLLFDRAFKNYRGTPLAEVTYRKLDPLELVCRCFAVYRSEIHQWLKLNPEIDFKEMLRKTKAGAGCTTCLETVKSIFQRFSAFPQQKINRPNYEYIDGNSPVQMILKIDEWLAGKGKIIDWREQKVVIKKKADFDSELLQNQFKVAVEIV